MNATVLSLKCPRLRWFFAFLTLAVSSLQAHAQDEAAAPSSACFAVIEAKPGVLPAAPILVDRCSGETFVLTKKRRGDPTTYEWVAIGKAESGSRVSAKPARSTASSAKMPARGNCFSYNGRTFCP